ncbi:MAG: hypothetical protein JJ909_07330 [Roseivirga sp.]|nr:hypothetical protein [Roseivirga sp.]
MIGNQSQIFFPSPDTRKKVALEVEIELRKHYQPGKYPYKTTGGKIIKFLFNQYNSKLLDSIVGCLDKDCLAFILYQYELSGIMSDLFKKNKLSKTDKENWLHEGGLYRQTCDYLCDIFASHSETESLNNDWFSRLDRVWALARMAIKISTIDNQEYMIFNSESDVIIHPPNQETFFGIENPSEDKIFCIQNIQNRSRVNIELRSQYLEGPSKEHDFIVHQEILEKAFEDSFEIKYSHYSYFLTSLHESVSPITSFKKIPAISHKQLKTLAEESGFRDSEITAFLRLASLSKKDFEKNPRQIWNSRQTNRVSKKPFIEFTFKNEKWLLWSNKKLNEYFILFDLDISFQSLLPEFRSNPLEKLLSQINRANGKWFEETCIKMLRSIGIHGSSVKSKLGLDCTISVPDFIGEIDFLGIDTNNKSIVVFEFKMTNTGYEPKGHRKELSDFIYSKKSYRKTFLRKVNWVENNFDSIKPILSQKYDVKDLNNTLYFTFLTHYASIAPCFMEDIPCPTAYEFVDGYIKNQNVWPYSIGIKSISK